MEEIMFSTTLNAKSRRQQERSAFMVSQVVSRFANQTRITDPEEYRYAYETLPNTVPELVRVVQGLFLHVFWAQRYGAAPNGEQETHVQARTVSRILDVTLDIDSSPLTAKRPFEKRFMGNCRDFSVTLCSMLRYKGIPARARCGFGGYFLPDHFEDHWITEYWNGSRWVSVDAQLDGLQRKVLRIDFDPEDMPKGKFVPASDAWLLCRSGRQDPNKFGILDMYGLWFIRGNLLRELAALNDAEMLPWDVWGSMNTPMQDLTQTDYRLLDNMAKALVEDSQEVHRLYASEPGLRVPQNMMVAGM